MPMQSSPVCIFCGGQPTTVEDILPKWLHRYLGNPKAKRADIDEHTGVMTFIGPSLSYTARAKITCQPCNNDFVSLFDTVASPLLKRMLAGGRLSLRLGHDSRVALARWAMKQALLMPFALEGIGQRIPVAVYHEFRQSGDPPADRVVLRMGGYRSRAIDSGATFATFTGTTKDGHPVAGQSHIESYGVTFCIKNLVWQVYGITNPGLTVGLLPDPIDPIAAVLLPLWPIKGDLDWPPPFSLNDPGLLRLANVFRRLGSSSP
jgi:hypothetical protein